MSHAVLSASGSQRWLNCPPSALLEKQFPDRTSSSAAEGTFAHAYGELKLQRYLNDIDQISFQGQLKTLKTNEFFCEDLDAYVQEYVDLCIEKINAAVVSGGCAMPEEKLNFGRWVPGGFGTGDMVIISKDVLEIVDLKYGQGVAVSAEGNTQMQLYALGAIDTYACLYDFDIVRMTICQPRNGGVSEQEMRVADLLAWGESIKPLAQAAIKGKGDFKAGDHCRFCKAAARCRALSDYSLDVAKHEFADPVLLSDDEIADVVLRVSALEKYAKAVNDYALKEAIAGKQWPGLKIVEGRSNRKISNVDLAANTLTAAGFDETKIYKPRELLSITNMEKAITKSKFNALLSDLIIKPDGKPTLVSVSDKRGEFSPAKNDFENINDEEE